MSLVTEYVKTLDGDLKPVAFKLLAEAPNLSFSQLSMLMKYYEASTLPTLKELNALKKEYEAFEKEAIKDKLEKIEEERAWLGELGELVELVEQLKAQANLAKRLDSPDLTLEEIQAYNKRWEPKLYKFIEDYRAGLI